jgi:hypothetical protein
MLCDRCTLFCREAQSHSASHSLQLRKARSPPLDHVFRIVLHPNSDGLRTAAWRGCHLCSLIKTGLLDSHSKEHGVFWRENHRGDYSALGAHGRPRPHIPDDYSVILKMTFHKTLIPTILASFEDSSISVYLYSGCRPRYSLP